MSRKFGILLLVAGLLLAAALLWWALRDVPLDHVLGVLGALRPWQILVILLVNTGMILLFALRWWLVLRARGRILPYLAVARYRMVAFAISYFTPGQHFGGEPVQVALLARNHKVPGSLAVATVALDKGMELFANFAVLAGGIAVLLAAGTVNGGTLRPALFFSITLLLGPAAYLLGVGLGWRPLGRLLRDRKGRIARGLADAETHLAELAGTPRLLLLCLLASALVWATIFFEFWLMLQFLGVDVTAVQLLAIVIAGRIALLAPTPGALGALEASQVAVMQALGLGAAQGLALGLLIRSRDIFFALVGLWLGGREGLSAYRRSTT